MAAPRPDGLPLGAGHHAFPFLKHPDFNVTHLLAPDIEAQTLALLAHRIATTSNKYPFTSVAFELALSEAYECLEATKAFLKKKEEEAKENLRQLKLNIVCTLNCACDCGSHCTLTEAKRLLRVKRDRRVSR